MKGIRSLLVLCSLFIMTAVHAQSGPEILFVNPNATLAGAGDVSIATVNGMYVYSNPASFLHNQGKYEIGASGVLFPRMENVEGREFFTALSGAVKMNEHHGLLLGMRYMGGITMQRISEQAIFSKNRVKPFDITVDLGYVYKITESLFTNISVSYIKSNAVQEGNNVLGSVGLDYFSHVGAENRGLDYHVGVLARNLGPKMKFGNNSKIPMPICFVLGGDATYNISGKSDITGLLNVDYYTSNSMNKAILNTHLGAKYRFSCLTVSAGTVLPTGDANPFLTFGVGYTGRHVNVNAAYQRELADKGVTAMTKCMVGVSYTF